MVHHQNITIGQGYTVFAVFFASLIYIYSIYQLLSDAYDDVLGASPD